MKASTPPATIMIIGIWNIWSSLSRRAFVAVQVLPAPDVSDSFFVAHDHDFAAAVDGCAVLTSRAAATACPLLRVNQLARSTFVANGEAEPAENADHLEVLIAQWMLVCDEDAGDVEIHHRPACKSDQQRR